MTSRERIQAVLNHKSTGLPIDFGSHRSAGMGAQAYNNLKKYLGYSVETTKLYDLMQQLAVPERFLIDRFGGDLDAGLSAEAGLRREDRPLEMRPSALRRPVPGSL